MMHPRSAALLATLALVSAAAPATAQAQPPGGMRMGGMMAGNRDTSTMAMMRLVHEMLANHDKLRRTVTNLPNGVRTVTESDDPAMRQVLREHVATTGELVRTSHDPNAPMESPSLKGVLRNGAQITRVVEQTATGVIVTETSADPATVALVQQHAAEITEQVKRGMAAVHEAMMKNGGMGGMGNGMGGMRGGPPAPPPPAAPAPAASAMNHDQMHAQMHGSAAAPMTHTTNTDSAFAAVQARGKVAMGVDQYTSTHQFDVLPDGGRIELQRNVDDRAGVATIRTHLQDIAKAFGSGDFSTPAFVHMQTVPGAQVLAARRSLITYTFTPLPRGGALRITTTDPAALAAVAQFMEFQRMDHRAH